MKLCTRRSLLTAAVSGAGALSAGCGRGFVGAAGPAPGGLRHLLEGVGRENLKITEVKATPLTFKAPAGSFIEEAGPIVTVSRGLTVLQVFTDKGIVGIGPGPSFGPAGPPDFSRLVGKNPFDVELMGPPAGVDVACWDIIGKAKGLPLYKLLATDHEPNPKVHVYGSAGVNWTFYDRKDGKPYGAAALIEEALKLKELGFDTYKWRPGTDWEEAGVTAESLGNTVCRKLREAVGPDFKLAIEKKAYDEWTLAEALAIAPIINELKFHWFEQPMGDQGPAEFDDYLTIKAAMPNVMLFGGEQFRDRVRAKPFIERKIYDVVQSDSISVGITENWYIARIAQYYGVRMTPHNWTSELGTICNAHLAAGVPNGYMCEYFMYPNTPWRDVLFKEPLTPKNGYLTLSAKPGLGVELADLEELKRKFPFDPGAQATIPNPRFPKAMDRARARQEQNRAKYAGASR
jgi:L-alanine-DL-glutamate epimerase-like enolase superfamily enzyme